MHLSWKVAAAVVIGGLSADPALAFHKHGCTGGGTTSSVTTVSVPATVTTRTRTSFASVPAFSGTSFGAPSSFNFSTAPSSFTLAPSSFTLIAPYGTNSTSGASSGDLATLNQSIQTLNATMATTNALLTKLVGGETAAPPGGNNPPVGPPGGGFGPPSGLSGVSGVPLAHVSALEQYQLRFDAHIRAGNLTDARHLWEKGVAYEKKWNATNAEMEKKLKELKEIK